MIPNPGGVLSGEAIVNRENEIHSIWTALQNQSVVIISERRIGKTSILRKMLVNPQNGWLPILYLIEGKEHPVEFVEGLYEILLEKDILKDKFHKLRQFYTKYVGGEQIGSWKLPKIKTNWKLLLDAIMQDILTIGVKVLIMLDELPLMLSKFIKSDEIGPVGTMAFLDTLREYRNKYEASKQIVFIFCGSVGIHLIIQDLKKNYGYNSDPINNMKIIPVSSMSEKGALELCERLSEDAPFRFNNRNREFDYICRETDRLPFYIQHVFAYFYESGLEVISKKQIDDCIQALVNDPHDSGRFRHYIDRIETYYGEHQKGISLTILDNACHKTDYWDEEDIINSIKSISDISAEIIKNTLKLPWDDHYLLRKIKNNKRAYKFRYSLLQKWWKVNRG